MAKVLTTMSATSSSSSEDSSVMPMDPPETEYESLLDISRGSFRRVDSNDSDLCNDKKQKENDDEDDETMTQLELHEEALRSSCEQEIRLYVQSLEKSEMGESAESTSTVSATIVKDPIPPSHFTKHRREQPTSVNANNEVPPSNDSNEKSSKKESSNNPQYDDLEIGDHVYQWRSFVGIPGVFQHHGIVMNIGVDENGDRELEIADFSCMLRSLSTSSNDDDQSKGVVRDGHSLHMPTGKLASNNTKKNNVDGILRLYKSSSSDQRWYKVVYNASVWKTSLWRSGTCTCVESDPPAKVLARAYFLLEHPELLPRYHIFQSNCECVACWCKTSQWCTLQASSLLSLTAAGQLKSTGTLAAYAASQQITTVTPAAGIWGYLGYTTTTQVSLLSTQPHLLPALAAYGVVTAGGPTFVLWKARRFWDKTTERLNKEFWEHALKDPDIFANSMMHWSERHRAFER